MRRGAAKPRARRIWLTPSRQADGNVEGQALQGPGIPDLDHCPDLPQCQSLVRADADLPQDLIRMLSMERRCKGLWPGGTAKFD